MLARVFLTAALGLLGAAAHAQPGEEVSSAELSALDLDGLAPLRDVLVLATPSVNVAASRSVSGPGEPFRFAEAFSVDVNPGNHGRWEITSTGRTAVWRLQVVSPGAVSLNLGFTRYWMPPGGRLRIHTPDGTEVIGPFTDADNESHGQLWTPVLSGGNAVIEVAVPAARVGDLRLELAWVNRGFRDLAQAIRAPPGSCNVDVACSEADPYSDQVRSVGLLAVNGEDACTGVLLNNTAEDKKPYFLTAGHCLEALSEEAPTAVVYWNYERPSCGTGTDGSRADFQTGAYSRARDGETDFALIELDDEPAHSHNLYLAGWERGETPPTSAFAVHHPQGSNKKISFENEPLTVTDYYSSNPSPTGKHLRVEDWDLGTTEAGSSGGPLFDQNSRVVGQLKGGRAFCGNDRADWYGWLAKSWTGGGAPGSRLSDWLDPGNTGAAAIDGTNVNAPPAAAGTLYDKALRLADGSTAGSLAVDVSRGFRDPEDQELTYTATSSDDAVVKATLAGSTVTVAPEATGTATITVTATDDLDASATQTFDVAVGTNRSPEPVGTIEGLSLTVDGGAESLSVAEAFEDDDADDLTYDASWSNVSVATATASAATVTVTPVSGGTATITVTATDVDGSNTTGALTFDVTVASRPPVAVGTLTALSLRVADGHEDVDVSAAFEDPDDDALTYAASSSAPAVVRATSTGAVVTLTPLARGTATVTVTARDVAGSNSAATQTFDVKVKAARGVTVSPGELTIDEGSTDSYTVVLNSEPTGPVTVTPSAPADLSVEPPSLTFTIANWSETRTVSVEAEHDEDAQASAPFTIAHQVSGSDYDSVSAPSVEVTVAEDDASTLSVQTPDPILEDGGTLVFWAALSVVSSKEVTVDYQTSDGSGAAAARSGSDYTAASGTLTFPAGSTSARQIAVEVLDDSADEEETETFSLTLSNARNASLAGGGQTLQTTGTLIDDDDPEVEVTFGSASYLAIEGGTVEVVVRLDQNPERDVQAPLLRTHYGGATEADYSGVPPSVVFAAGETTQRFLFGATDDGEDDDGEAVVLSLGSLPPRVNAGDGTTIAIQDNNAGAGVDGGGGGDGGGSGSGGGGGGSGGGGGGDDGGGDDAGSDGGGSSPQAAIGVSADCRKGLCGARTDVPVVFEDTSSGFVPLQRWDFGDGISSRNRTVEHSWSRPGFYSVVLWVSDGTHESTDSLTFLVEANEPVGTCTADALTLCLQDSRYSVRTEWWAAAGNSGMGLVVHSGTNDSGLFRFFDHDNWEVLIKVLDGCSLNGHVWVFGASTTDLGYSIRVTDTVSGMVREYRNEPGRPAAAITDGTAFPQGCRPD